VRGFEPWPGCYTILSSRKFLIWKVELGSLSSPEFAPGQILAARGDDLIVQCGSKTSLRLLEVQPEAKRRMNVRDFLNGTHLKVGDRLGKSD
jgi:methionyl-tRNA formyltransferase